MAKDFRYRRILLPEYPLKDGESFREFPIVFQSFLAGTIAG
jgi:hypothetical protein